MPYKVQNKRKYKNTNKKRRKSRYKLVRFWSSLTPLGKALVLLPVFFLLLFLGGRLKSTHTLKDYAPDVYTYLVQAGYTPEGACGALGNMDVESGVFPCIKQGCDPEDKVSRSYTHMVDAGKISREDFTKDAIGYGLIGFTHYSTKEVLYDTAAEAGKSIGDLYVQLDAVIALVKESYPGLDTTLRTSHDVHQCALEFAYDLERSAALLGLKGEDAKTQSENERYNRAVNYLEMLDHS